MNISLTKDTLTPDLRRKLLAVGRPRTVFEAGAKAVQVEISRHLKRLESRGNAMGWPSQHFFFGKADSVEKRVGIAALTDTGARIAIADPRFVHRIVGGTVAAKRRKYLAIPLTAQAYALSGQGSLRQAAAGLEVRFPFLGYEQPDGSFDPWFLLRQSVTHRAHPDEAPDKDELGRAAGKAMRRVVNLLLRARGTT